MAFLYTNEGNYVAVGAIRKARPMPNDVVRVYTDETSYADASADEWHKALTVHASTVIPAQPGYFRLEKMNMEDADAEPHQEPVVGWLVSTTGTIVPVTAQGWDLNFPDVLMPDGRVGRLDSWSDTLDEWKAGPGSW